MIFSLSVLLFVRPIDPPGSGGLVFSDSRGHMFPFGRELLLKPQEGQVVMFPSWLQHSATTSAGEWGSQDAAPDEEGMYSLQETSEKNSTSKGRGKHDDQRKVSTKSGAPSSSSDADARVILAFNVGPMPGSTPPRAWFQDPTAKVWLRKYTPVDPELYDQKDAVDRSYFSQKTPEREDTGKFYDDRHGEKSGLLAATDAFNVLTDGARSHVDDWWNVDAQALPHARQTAVVTP